jgi:hypothetical protein
MRRPLVLALMLYSLPLAAQVASHTISPGMTKAQVIAALGEPATSRTVGEDSYLFYLNTCGKKCGMNDLVVLHADSVADAIFRAPDRHYTGKSSSPTAIPQSVASRAKPGTAGEAMKMPADSTAKQTTRMKPAPPSDTRPSIPVHPATVKPAPSTTKAAPATAKPTAAAPKPAATTAKPAPTTKPVPKTP